MIAMKYIIRLLGFLMAHMLIFGCATLIVYQTPEMLKIKSSIDRSKALNLFTNILIGSNGASGFCSAWGGLKFGRDCKKGNCYGYDRNSEGAPSVNNTGISFKAWKAGEYIRLNQYRREYFIKQINFDDITRVVIADLNSYKAMFGNSYKTLFTDCIHGDFMVLIEYPLSNEELKFTTIFYGAAAHVTISNNDVDTFVASLSILAPKTRILLSQQK